MCAAIDLLPQAQSQNATSFIMSPAGVFPTSSQGEHSKDRQSHVAVSGLGNRAYAHVHRVPPEHVWQMHVCLLLKPSLEATVVPRPQSGAAS